MLLEIHVDNVILVYINSKWRRVKMCLGCIPFEEKHSSEKLADWVDSVIDSWDIREQVYRCI